MDDDDDELELCRGWSEPEDDILHVEGEFVKADPDNPYRLWTPNESGSHSGGHIPTAAIQMLHNGKWVPFSKAQLLDGECGATTEGPK